MSYRDRHDPRIMSPGEKHLRGTERHLDRIRDLEAKLAAVEGLPRYAILAKASGPRNTYRLVTDDGNWIKAADIQAILRPEVEES